MLQLEGNWNFEMTDNVIKRILHFSNLEIHKVPEKNKTIQFSVCHLLLKRKYRSYGKLAV